jgi:hypothetical protein
MREGKFIEVSVSYVDRTVDPPQSFTAGIIQFDQDDLEKEPEVLNPIDFSTMAVLKAYFDAAWKEHGRMRAFVEKKQKALEQDGVG